MNGNISIEYERDWENTVPDIAQCVGYPLEKAAEAYDRMMSGKARFRVVLTMGNYLRRGIVRPRGPAKTNQWPRPPRQNDRRPERWRR